MLYSKTTPEQKRLRLRDLLSSGTIQQFPGAFSPLSARLIEEKGFPGVYISGAVLANDLGLPDIGLTTLTEVATMAGQIARMTELPCLVDADTGFGEPMNVARTIHELENAGLASAGIGKNRATSSSPAISCQGGKGRDITGAGTESTTPGVICNDALAAPYRQRFQAPQNAD